MRRERKRMNNGADMKKGVIIEGGVHEWEIFQQDAHGEAELRVWGTCHRVRQEFELPMRFHAVTEGTVTVKARVALESSGEDVCPWTLCTVHDESRWEIRFRVPAGGLYRFETCMEYEGWDGLSSTRGDMVHNFGVGDIFVVAGQSNAAGRGKNPVEDAPELGVHLLRCSGMWDLATHPLGETTGAKHIGHFENHNPGHTPWLQFAKLLKRELGYPIGIVMSAYGGAPLRWWNPAENGALTENMLAQIAEYDIHPKGILWYQGEAEGCENAADTYLERFAAFVGAVRERLGQPRLPIITVQLNRCLSPTTPALDRQWGVVRQAQADAARQIPGVYVVPANDISVYDFIHNSAQGDLVIGARCARCALCELYGRKVEWRAPEIRTAVLTAPDTVEARFEKIENWINTFDVAAELLPIEAEDDEGILPCCSYDSGPDTLTLHFPRPLAGHARLHGMWRMNPGVCTPCDCMRMPILSFYGFPVAEKGTP